MSKARQILFIFVVVAVLSVIANNLPMPQNYIHDATLGILAAGITSIFYVQKGK